MLASSGKLHDRLRYHLSISGQSGGRATGAVLMGAAQAERKRRLGELHLHATYRFPPEAPQSKPRASSLAIRSGDSFPVLRTRR